MQNLTHKQLKFAELVASGKTYAESYRIAYPVSKKWKNEAVWVQSSILMTNSKVVVMLAEIQEKRAERNEITITELLERLARWVRFNPKTIMNADGTMKEFSEMSDDEAECIQDFQIEEVWGGRGEDREVKGMIKKVKIIDKRATADMFMKKFGAYITNVKLDVEDLSHLQGILDGIK